MCRQQKTAGSTSRIVYCIARFGTNYGNNGINQGAWREVLSGTALHIGGVLFQQAFVGIAFYVSVDVHPLFATDQVKNQALELCCILNLVLSLAKDHAQHSALFSQLDQDVAVLAVEVFTVQVFEAVPAQVFGDDGGLAVRRFGLLVRHFQEEQERELFDVVAVGEAVVAEKIAVVPEFLDDSVGSHLFRTYGAPIFSDR